MALLESFWKPGGAFHDARPPRPPKATLIVIVLTSRLSVWQSWGHGCPHDLALALLVLTCQRVLSLVCCLRVFSPSPSGLAGRRQGAKRDVMSIIFRPIASWRFNSGERSSRNSITRGSSGAHHFNGNSMRLDRLQLMSSISPHSPV
jgi:hypothetical protein